MTATEAANAAFRKSLGSAFQDYRSGPGGAEGARSPTMGAMAGYIKQDSPTESNFWPNETKPTPQNYTLTELDGNYQPPPPQVAAKREHPGSPEPNLAAVKQEFTTPVAKRRKTTNNVTPVSAAKASPSVSSSVEKTPKSTGGRRRKTAKGDGDG